MKDKWFRINSFLGLVQAMRSKNFVDYIITSRDEILVLMRIKL